jgi:hypothetical protein
MSELERILANLRLAAPSAALDRRMSDMFSATTRTPPSLRRTSLGWWLGALAATGAVVTLLLVSPWPLHPRPEQIVYRIEAKGPMRQLLLEPPASANRLPRLVVNGSTP